MANYTLANLVKAQIKLQGEFAANDNRYRIPVVFLMFLRGSQTLFPDYKTLKTSETRAIEANYFKRTAVALGSAFSHNHTGTGGDSGVVSLSWSAKTRTFTMTLKQANTSVWSFQEEFENEIRQCVIDFANGLESTAATYLFNNRSGVNTAAVKGTFNATNDVYAITQSTYGDEAMMITKVVMDINKYQGIKLNIVCDSIAYTTFLKQAAQGASNSTNLSFQFMGIEFIHDASMTAAAAALDATYTKGMWIAVPEGYVACLDWIPVENRRGIETSVNMYGSLRNPVDGLQYATHTYETRSDGTSVNGQVQDVTTETQMGIYVSFNHAPSSVANETPMMAFVLV